MKNIEFGIFDHLDRRPDVGLGQTYEDRLKLVEAYDRAGFHAYHIAEHHATPLTVAPSPSVFLSAVAQRTSRIRFGPMVYVLPLHHPLRLIEEISMLDHMSNGRFDLGIGRGISPFELRYFSIDPDQVRQIHDEILDIVLTGLQSDSLTHRGKHFDFDDVPLPLNTVQTPHPPLWVGIGTPEGAEGAGRRGVNVLTNLPLAASAELMTRFRAAFTDAHGGQTLPRLSVCRHIYVADTDAEAERIMREAYDAWFHHFIELFRKHGAGPAAAQYIADFDETRKKDLLVFGSPATVRAEIERYMDTIDSDYFVARFAYGSLSYEQSRAALDLFTEEVMPHFTGGAH